MRARAIVATLALLLSAGVSGQADSQAVLQRYALALDAAPVPKAVVFSYTVSQAGPTNIEQRHIVYRSGSDVRDETVAVDGVALSHKVVHFSRRDDRYAIGKLAPRPVAYQMLFLETVRDGSHVDYVYEATPLLHASEAYIDRLTIDGKTYLPRTMRFHTAGGTARGTGSIEYAKFGKYWMPVVAEIDATVGGHAARERIAWTDYRFPGSLPPSTFAPPKPLPHATLPPI